MNVVKNGSADVDEGMEAEDKGVEDADEVANDEATEGRRPRIPVDPGKPTQREIDEHEASGHTTFRPWCKWCVEGKAI